MDARHIINPSEKGRTAVPPPLPAAFHYDDHPTLRLTSLPRRTFTSYLCYAIRRHPAALYLHLHRIDLAYRGEDREQLFAALLDLWLVLGRGGRALRTRLYEATLPRLGQEEAKFLADRMITGIRPEEPLPGSRPTLLGRGLTGHLPILVRKSDKRQTTDTP